MRPSHTGAGTEVIFSSSCCPEKLHTTGGQTTMRTLFFMLAGYLSGSVLYAHVWGRFISHRDVTAGTRDGNPGTANAFTKGGFLCGILTLFCDIAKGFFPVWLFLLQTDHGDLSLALILAAPVLGHVFPLFYHFQGGKGIAVSFGCLLGLCPFIVPAVILAACFILFSTVLVISPHYYRTLASYVSATVLTFLTVKIAAVRWGMLLISGTIVSKLMTCDEKKEQCKVKLL